MNTKKLYSMDEVDLTNNCNRGLEIYLNSLLDNKVINKKQHEELSGYRIVLHNKGFFGSMFDKFFKKEDTPMFTIVKVLPIKLSEEKDENS